jgi:hypothetical protein
VKQGKLGYYIGHHSHVQSAEAGEEVIIKPGERDRAAQAFLHTVGARVCCHQTQDNYCSKRMLWCWVGAWAMGQSLLLDSAWGNCCRPLSAQHRH